MEVENLLNLRTREELRAWLQMNCRTAKHCWVEVSITPKPNTLLYLDVVEEALCFGWIDSIKKTTEDMRHIQRISPRSNKSSWTELNKERVRRLEKLGLMEAEGRKVLPEMDINSFIIQEEIEQILKDDPIVFENFMNFPELYRRIRIDTIQQVKKQPELFAKRLDKLIVNTRFNKMYGSWNDDGRLVD